MKDPRKELFTNYLLIRDISAVKFSVLDSWHYLAFPRRKTFLYTKTQFELTMTEHPMENFLMTAEANLPTQNLIFSANTVQIIRRGSLIKFRFRLIISDALDPITKASGVGNVIYVDCHNGSVSIFPQVRNDGMRN